MRYMSIQQRLLFPEPHHAAVILGRAEGTVVYIRMGFKCLWPMANVVQPVLGDGITQENRASASERHLNEVQCNAWESNVLLVWRTYAGTRLNEDKWPIAIKMADHRTAIDNINVNVRSPRVV